MEIFCCNEIILEILTFPMMETKIIFKYTLKNHLLSYEY
jgi:hypothetical protein